MTKLIPNPVGSERELEHFFGCANCRATWELVYRYNERCAPKMPLRELSLKWATLPEKKRESLCKQLTSDERKWFKSLNLNNRVNYLHLFSKSLQMSSLPNTDTKSAWDALPQHEKQVFIEESKTLRSQQKTNIHNLTGCLRAQYRLMKHRKRPKNQHPCNAFHFYLTAEWAKMQFVEPIPKYKTVMLDAAERWKSLTAQQKHVFEEQAAQDLRKLVGYRLD
jgi:hypothetical protein